MPTQRRPETERSTQIYSFAQGCLLVDDYISFPGWGFSWDEIRAVPSVATATILNQSNAYTEIVPARSGVVSFTDSEGIEHTVRVPAESLYEAAIEAMAASRRSVLAEMPLGPFNPTHDSCQGAGGRTHNHCR